MVPRSDLQGALVYTHRSSYDPTESIKLELRMVDLAGEQPRTLLSDLHRPNSAFSAYSFPDIQHSADGKTITAFGRSGSRIALCLVDLQSPRQPDMVIPDWAQAGEGQAIKRKWDWYSLSQDGSVILASAPVSEKDFYVEYSDDIKVPMPQLEQFLGKVAATKRPMFQESEHDLIVFERRNQWRPQRLLRSRIFRESLKANISDDGQTILAESRDGLNLFTLDRGKWRSRKLADKGGSFLLSANGKTVLYRLTSESGSASLFVTHAEDGWSSNCVTRGKGSDLIWELAISSDGNQVLFAHIELTKGRTIWALTRENKKWNTPTQILRTPPDVNYGRLYVSDTHAIVSTVAEFRTNQASSPSGIYWFKRSGNEWIQHRVPVVPERDGPPEAAITPRGDMMALLRDHLYIVNFPDRVLTVEQIEPRVGGYNLPLFSPDGKSVAVNAKFIGDNRLSSTMPEEEKIRGIHIVDTQRGELVKSINAFNVENLIAWTS